MNHLFSLWMALAASFWIAGKATIAAAPRPNILWITAEDMSPNLGCYGDTFARSPNLDAFARQAVRYTRAFATAPVCAPSRVCLITGLYATTLGNPHLRCEMTLPAEFKSYAAALRGAEWFTSNNVKTDYNLRDEAAFIRAAWNQSSAQAHWRRRAAGQPFFAVFNLMETHQSRTSVWPWEQFEKEIAAQLPPGERSDPKEVPLPPFYPDTPLARRAMARYYDCIAVMDQKAGRILRELEADGLAEDTIVFFYSDHGMGMPRGKRVLHDSGLHVPLLIRFPKKWQHFAPAKPGEAVDRLVSFVDFAPTVLSLAGVPVPKQMQGMAFLGPAAGAPREFVIGARDRVDEVIDTARSVRDGRWLYIRNFRPHLSWAPPEGYSDQSDFRRELLQMGRAGKLTVGAAQYASSTRPAEELYDTAADPHQLRNLAGESAHKSTLERMRARLHQWQIETRDLGLLPEADMMARAGGESPYEMARRAGKYPVERVLAAAERVGWSAAIPQMCERLKDADTGVRYWSIIGLRAAGDAAISAKSELEQALRDSAAAVRIEAAGALLDHVEHPAALQLLTAELRSADGNVALHAARTLELLGARARPLLPAMRECLAIAQAAEGKETLAMFIRFALETAIRNLESGSR